MAISGPEDVNPRVITDKQMSDLKKSLKKFNLVEIPAIDFDGKILAGHQRIKALQKDSELFIRLELAQVRRRRRITLGTNPLGQKLGERQNLLARTFGVRSNRTGLGLAR